jgi:hypothetical protein
VWRNAYADIGIFTDSEFAVIYNSVSVQIFDVTGTVVLRDDRDLFLLSIIPFNVYVMRTAL